MRVASRTVLTLMILGLLALPGYAQSNSGSASNSGDQARQSTAGQSSSASDQASDQKSAKSGAMSDQEFVRKAAEGDLAEVQMSKLAEQKASSDSVKKFAEHLMQDHEKNEESVKQLAQKEGVNLPDKLNAKDQAGMDRLQKLNGAAFDKAFAQHEVKDHEKDVREFSKEVSSAKNPDVKAFASETLPVLQQHLEMARSTAKEEGANSSMSHHQKGNKTPSSSMQ